MSDNKIKVYKNPERGRPEKVMKYVPEYRSKGIEPSTSNFGSVGTGTFAAPIISDPNNPRLRQPGMKQSFASSAASTFPNVGNNIDYAWSNGVDGEMIVDDISHQLSDNHIMIDNNEYVSDAALGVVSKPTSNLENSKPLVFDNEMHPKDSEIIESQDDLQFIIQDLQEEEYLLLVNGVAICSGLLPSVEDQARALIFGEHELCDSNPIPAEDIIILKRVKIKIGLFVD